MTDGRNSDEEQREPKLCLIASIENFIKRYGPAEPACGLRA
jgi:hypothetical protein